MEARVFPRVQNRAADGPRFVHLVDGVCIWSASLCPEGGFHVLPCQCTDNWVSRKALAVVGTPYQRLCINV
ncbi:hypothetical protein ACOMHN_011707 [Nucella lapillus]